MLVCNSKKVESSLHDEADAISTASSSTTSVPDISTTSTNPISTVINNPTRVVDAPGTATQQISTSFPQVSNDTVSTQVAIVKRVAKTSIPSTDIEVKGRKLMEKEKDKTKKQFELFLQYVIGMQHT